MNDGTDLAMFLGFISVLIALNILASVAIYNHGVDAGKTEVYKLAVESGYADAIADVENDKIVYRFKVGE